MSENREQLIKSACQGDEQALEKLLLICQPDINASLDEYVQHQKMLRMLFKLHYGRYIEK